MAMSHHLKSLMKHQNDHMKLNDEVTQLPCSECGEKKTVNVVYLPYLNEYLCNDKECPWKKKKK